MNSGFVSHLGPMVPLGRGIIDQQKNIHIQYTKSYTTLVAKLIFSLSCNLCPVGKSENLPEVTDSEETTEVEETQIVQPVSENEESEPKPEVEQEENGSGSQITFDYERLKAKSDNPVTGIDFKQREVGYFENNLAPAHFASLSFLITLFLLSGISL